MRDHAFVRYPLASHAAPFSGFSLNEQNPAMPHPTTVLRLTTCLLLFLALLLPGCGGTASREGAEGGDASRGGLSRTSTSKLLELPVPSDGPKSMDPAEGSTLYENMCVVQSYETLLQYKYLTRPLQLEPLLLAEMPTVSDDGLTYRFRLKPGIRFHDDPCFPDGKGRELVAADVLYTFKRLMDDDVSLKNRWLVENTIVGFDQYADAQNAAPQYDYEAAVAGMRIVNDHEFEIELVEPVQRFVWTLAMFQTSIVAREAVETYGDRFARKAIGTGPYRMEKWIENESMTFVRNPNYHGTLEVGDDVTAENAEAWKLTSQQQLPLNEGLVYHFFVEEQPMWLQFRSGKLDYTRVPKDNFGEAFNKRTRQLSPAFQKLGITAHAVPLLDFIFYGFNMEDPLLGGYTDEKKYLRQAISLAMDWDERNDAIYNNICLIYDGMIPPGLEGHPEDGRAPNSYRGPDLQRARELLAKAGYPDGKGLPVIDYYSSLEGPGKENAEITARQLAKIGIKLNPRLDVFSAFIESVNNRKAPFFSFAWGSDYPDGENNLALFYGPNESPGANHFNYQNAEFDKLYEQIRSMPPSPERTAIYERMRDMVIEDTPFVGSMARTRYYLGQPWLKNFHPTEDFMNWTKYLVIETP
jgi:ABC-type transport system substrate-binding protein